MTTRRRSALVRTILGLALAGATAATGAEAQLTNASASGVALAGNNTASARGFEAISVNPAGLGMPGSGFSLAVAPIQLRMGLAPIDFGDLVTYEGQVIPDEVKAEWLDRVVAAGGESGSVGADASMIALTLGNIGFQLSTTAAGDVNLPPGLVEAALYGNAGRTNGTAVDLSLIGASIESYALTTAAVSFALPINPALVVGLTGKYSYGHGLAFGRSESGALEADPIRATLEFPLVTSCQNAVGCTQDYVQGGSGFGLDLGAMLDLGQITLGATLVNVVSNFAWDETKLSYRPGTVLFEDGAYQTDYDELPFESAPDELKARVRDFTPPPGVRLGAALELTPTLTLTGDIHGQLADDGLALQPNYSTGVGALLELGLLNLRGGLTKIDGGVQLGGGIALAVGPVHLSGALGLRKGSLSDTVLAQFGLSFGAH